jgi:hypothetical protein
LTGTTLNLTLGTLFIDAGTTAIASTLPILNATNNGTNFSVQKTSATNHNIVLTAGTGNQIASLAGNVLGATYTLTNAIYQQSFRFINPNWYPY